MKMVITIVVGVFVLALVPIASYALGGATIVTAILTLCAVVLPACVLIYRAIETKLFRDEQYQLLSAKLDERLGQCAPKVDNALALMEKIDHESLGRAFVPGNGSDKIMVRARHLVPLFAERFREIREYYALGTIAGLQHAEELLDSPLPVPRDTVRNLLDAQQIGSLHPSQWEPLLSQLLQELESVDFVQEERFGG